MKTLTKEKRQQFILVVVLTLGVLLGLWFGVVRAQQRSLNVLAQKKEAAERLQKTMRQTIEGGDSVESKLEDVRGRLARCEESMASGDLYSWAINTIRQFKLPYRVDIPQFSQIDGPKEVSLLPRFPYKQASLTVGGTARYHDLGKFIADLENQFPYFRVVNLGLEPATGNNADAADKLTFRMDIVVLVKPNAS